MSETTKRALWLTLWGGVLAVAYAYVGALILGPVIPLQVTAAPIQDDPTACSYDPTSKAVLERVWLTAQADGNTKINLRFVVRGAGSQVILGSHTEEVEVHNGEREFYTAAVPVTVANPSRHLYSCSVEVLYPKGEGPHPANDDNSRE